MEEKIISKMSEAIISGRRAVTKQLPEKLIFDRKIKNKRTVNKKSKITLDSSRRHFIGLPFVNLSFIREGVKNLFTESARLRLADFFMGEFLAIFLRDLFWIENEPFPLF